MQGGRVAYLAQRRRRLAGGGYGGSGGSGLARGGFQQDRDPLLRFVCFCFKCLSPLSVSTIPSCSTLCFQSLFLKWWFLSPSVPLSLTVLVFYLSISGHSFGFSSSPFRLLPLYLYRYRGMAAWGVGRAGRAVGRRRCQGASLGFGGAAGGRPVASVSGVPRRGASGHGT